MVHHGGALRALTKDAALSEALADDWRSAPIGDRERALCGYAEKLTLRPREMARGDLEALRAQGLGDADILVLAQVVAYFNYVNRLADGLGVELEEPSEAKDG